MCISREKKEAKETKETKAAMKKKEPKKMGVKVKKLAKGKKTPSVPEGLLKKRKLFAAAKVARVKAQLLEKKVCAL